MAAKKKTTRRPTKGRSSTPDPDQVPVMMESAPDPYVEAVNAELSGLSQTLSEYTDSLHSPSVTEAYELREHDTPRQAAKERESITEAIIFNPKVNAVPVGTGSQMAKLALEDLLWQSGPSNSVVALHTINLVSVVKACVVAYQTNPLAKNIIETYTRLTVGEGVRVAWTGGSNGRRVEKLNSEWKRIEKRVGFQQYVRKMVRMTFMCGEWFSVTTPIRKTRRARKLAIQGVEPDLIERIFVAPDDISDVRGYERKGPNGERAVLPPEDVVHSRVNVIGNIPRGLPVLLPVLLPLRFYELFIENRHWLGMSRARIPIIRKVMGNSSKVAAEKSRIQNQGLPKPGTILTDPSGYEWEFPSLNLGASDAAVDRQALVQMISAGVSLPEWLVTADLQSANYSSAIVAESPMVRMFMDYQELAKEWIEELICELMDVNSDQFEIQMPPVVRRGVGELSAALGVAVDRRFLSKKSAAEMLGKTWDGPNGEKERIADEAEFEYGMDPFGVGTSTPMDTDGKKVDGGIGSVPTGTSQGAAASSRSRPTTDPDPGPNVPKAAAATGAEDVPDAEQAAEPAATLNGAQIASLLQIVQGVTSGELTMETAVQLIIASFPFDEERARTILADAKKAEVAPDEVAT